MHPPFFFVLPKKNPPEGLLLPLRGNSPSAPCTVEEKGAWGLKLDLFQGQVWAETWGPNKKPWQLRQASALGAVLVLAIFISLTSGLRRKLTHSDARPLPTKTAALGFREDPYWAETFRREARDALLPCVGLQN